LDGVKLSHVTGALPNQGRQIAFHHPSQLSDQRHRQSAGGWQSVAQTRLINRTHCKQQAANHKVGYVRAVEVTGADALLQERRPPGAEFMDTCSLQAGPF
jgi:hypothetical protein